MQIQTMSIVVASQRCNSSCPYCVSKMTDKTKFFKLDFNKRNFDIACKYAFQNNVSTLLFTGKGEPTLYPKMINNYLEYLNYNDLKYYFPFKELQTNGIIFLEDKFRLNAREEEWLAKWYERGLTTICLSIIHYESDKNKEIFGIPKDHSYDLLKITDMLHKIGYLVRWSCIMIKDYIDSYSKIKKLIFKAKEYKVEQLTIRPVSKPGLYENENVYKWVLENEISNEKLYHIKTCLGNYPKLMELVHGATVYDVNGQNVCLSNCLTIQPEEKDKLRQIIFYPDGSLYYDWQYEGARLL